MDVEFKMRLASTTHVLDGDSSFLPPNSEEKMLNGSSNMFEICPYDPISSPQLLWIKNKKGVSRSEWKRTGLQSVATHTIPAFRSCRASAWPTRARHLSTSLSWRVLHQLLRRVSLLIHAPSLDTSDGHQTALCSSVKFSPLLNQQQLISKWEFFQKSPSLATTEKDGRQ